MIIQYALKRPDRDTEAMKAVVSNMTTAEIQTAQELNMVLERLLDDIDM